MASGLETGAGCPVVFGPAVDWREVVPVNDAWDSRTVVSVVAGTRRLRIASGAIPQRRRVTDIAGTTDERR
jgi:hypothetical protein